MAAFFLVITAVEFLSGGLAAVFIMLVIGIRKVDRARRRRGSRDTPLDAFIRTTMGASTWPASPVVHGNLEGS